TPTWFVPSMDFRNGETEVGRFVARRISAPEDRNTTDPGSRGSLQFFTDEAAITGVPGVVRNPGLRARGPGPGEFGVGMHRVEVLPGAGIDEPVEGDSAR